MPDMLVKLYELPPLEPALAKLRDKNVVIRPARSFEKHLVTNWVSQQFAPSWASECEVGFTHHPCRCHIALRDGELLGFACHDVTALNFFGPLGVDPSLRGGGIGAGLLLSVMHAMAAQGYAYAVIGAAGPLDFYNRIVGATEIPGSVPGIYRDLINPETGGTPCI